MKFVVYNLGCKVNQYEGLSMMKELSDLGHEVSDILQPADVYVINTCAVTGEAEAKSRRYAARAARLNPDAEVLIVGCSAQVNPKNFPQNVRVIGGVASKNAKLMRYIERMEQGEGDIFHIPSHFEEITQPKLFHARNYIKIQDGCNNFCSYCIVPHARGRSRSRLLSRVLLEIEQTQSKEIIFTGINMSAYQDEQGHNLVDLVRAVCGIEGKRFRISSLEPNVISVELLKAWRSSPMCPHFHLSMQSGSNEILHKMNRHYTSEIFLEKVDLIRSYLPNAAITTDVIAGFPTESDQHHRETIATIERVQFADIHVFPYSERKGTVAAGMPQIPMEVRRERAAEIAQIGENLRKLYVSSFIGKPLQVLSETLSSGTSENYITIHHSFSSKGVFHTLTPTTLSKNNSLTTN